MTARKADPRVERWAKCIVEGWDDLGPYPADNLARRIVRAIDRARREERKAFDVALCGADEPAGDCCRACGQLMHVTYGYAPTPECNACAQSILRDARAILSGGARERGKR